MNPQLFPQTSSAPETPAPAPAANDPAPQKFPTNDLIPPATGRLAGLERRLYKLFAQQLPQVSTAGRDLMSDYVPWVALIMCMVMFPIIAAGIINSGAIGIITSINSFNTNPAYWVSLVLFVIQFVLMCVGTWHTLTHHRTGWKLLFNAACIGVLYVIPSIFAGFSNPLITTPVLIGLLFVSFYVLYQVRGYYTD